MEISHHFRVLAAKYVKKPGQEMRKIDTDLTQRLAEANQKNWMEIQKVQALEQIHTENFRRKEQIKLAYEERRRENRLAQTEEVLISPGGEISVHTQNLHMQSQGRRVCNFTNPQLTELCSTEGDEGLLSLEINVSGNKKCSIMLVERIFDVDYFEKKLGMQGAFFVASSSYRRRAYVRSFVAALLSCETPQTIILPAHIGWNKLSNGGWKFAEREDETWKYYQKIAK